MHYAVSSIAKIINASDVSIGADAEIKHLLIDSRKLSSPDNSLFFAIKGARNDGHKFIADLYLKGIRNFIVSDIPENISQFTNANILKVEDTLHALQKLVEYHRSQFTIPVVGITGSNGKTIVKRMAFSIVARRQKYCTQP